MQYFPEITNIEEMRSQFRKLCLKLHPDKKTGDPEAFKAMKAEYDTIIQRLSAKEAFSAKAENRETKYNYEKEKNIMEAIERFMKIPGIVIELCGSWLWISGNTFPVHNRIREQGAKYSRSKKQWYYSPYMHNGRMKGRYSMKKIREKYGSEIIENEKEKYIAA